MLKHISAFVNDIVAPEHRWKIKILRNWNKIIGNIGNRVIILKIDKKVLVLGVTHSVWAQELFMLSDTIKNKINAELGSKRIEKISFKLINAEKKNKIKQKIPPFKKDSFEKKFSDKLFLTRNEYKTLSKVNDDELKKQLKLFYAKSKRMSNDDSQFK